MFYNTLSNKAKDKFLELWQPKMHDRFKRDLGEHFGVIVGLINDNEVLKKCITNKFKQFIPYVSIELAFDMLEKMGYYIDSKTRAGYYLTHIWNQNSKIGRNEYGETRLESLKEALKYALELEVE